MLQKMQNEYQTVTENGKFCGFLYFTTPKCKAKLLTSNRPAQTQTAPPGHKANRQTAPANRQTKPGQNRPNPAQTAPAHANGEPPRQTLKRGQTGPLNNLGDNPPPNRPAPYLQQTAPLLMRGKITAQTGRK